VREESHLDEMRSAIRGDFERLAARRGDQELLLVGEPRAPEETRELRDGDEQPLSSIESGAAEEQLEEPDPEPAEEERPRRSWLARMLST